VLVAQIVADAYDRTDLNLSADVWVFTWVQVFKSDKTHPAPSFSEPHTTIIFDRLPSTLDAPKIAYTRIVASRSMRKDHPLPHKLPTQFTGGYRNGTRADCPGDYVLRIIGADYPAMKLKLM
jgi:hypothetical protein